jgi:hypothetical protein
LNLLPQDIADSYTLAEIEIEITAIKTAISNARDSLSDKFADGQADQQVRRQSLETLRQELAIYLKAKNILNGTTSSTAELISGDYNPCVPRI